MKKVTLLSSFILSLSLVTADAATVFVTTTTGNAAGLEGASQTDPLTTTDLTLSAEDGGGTLTVTTHEVNRNGGADSLGMTAASMGVNNEKWGSNNQQWLFSFDQTVDFDALDFINFSNNIMSLASSAWVGDANTSGTNWTFDGTSGTFTFQENSAAVTFDFTSAGVSSVPADTQILLNHETGFGGAGLTSFTISPVPEPSTLGLIGLAGLGLLLRRRRS